MATPGLCESFHFTQHESEGEETRVRRGDKHTSGVGGRRVRRRHGDGGGGEGGGGGHVTSLGRIRNAHLKAVL